MCNFAEEIEDMANEINNSKRDLTILSNGLATSDSEYVRLVSLISDTWENAKGRAALAVNTELLEANWQTGRYIVEFEQQGNAKARYGEQLITNLAKDLTRLRGKGFSRSNLIYMRKFYLTFPKSETLSHQLTWSHYFELLKCDDTMEMQFYMKECINQGWRVRELKRNEIKHSDIGQMNLYLNYFKNEVCQPDDNPPVGIVLGARKDELLMEYALQGIDNQLFAARYQLYLPNREELQSELDRLLDNTK